MKSGVNTRKLYYGFPIFIIGYQDTDNVYNITTCSSSYSLGEMVVVGVSKNSNVAKQVTTYKKLSINVIGQEHLNLIEYAGYNHAKSKLINTNISYKVYNDVPVLEESQITLLAKVEQIVSYDNFVNFICKIEERLYGNDTISGEDINYEMINPVLYIGDDKKRVYKLIEKQSIETGSFIENAIFTTK